MHFNGATPHLGCIHNEDVMISSVEMLVSPPMPNFTSLNLR